MKRWCTPRFQRGLGGAVAGSSWQRRKIGAAPTTGSSSSATGAITWQRYMWAIDPSLRRQGAKRPATWSVGRAGEQSPSSRDVPAAVRRLPGQSQHGRRTRVPNRVNTMRCGGFAVASFRIGQARKRAIRLETVNQRRRRHYRTTGLTTNSTAPGEADQGGDATVA